MDPNVFRKGDAPSCLVVDKSWDDIVNKPEFFNELVERVVAMMKGAEDIGLLKKSTTLGQLKEAINTILLRPLQSPTHGGDDPKLKTPGSILVDAFWDEIPQIEEKWKKFKEAIARAYNMKMQIDDHQPLTERDTIQTTKDIFNDTVVKPMLGINEDE